MEGVRFVEKQCPLLHMGQANWSPEITQVLLTLRYWTSSRRKLPSGAMSSKVVLCLARKINSVSPSTLKKEAEDFFRDANK